MSGAIPLYSSKAVPVRCNGCAAAGAAHVVPAKVAFLRPPKGWYLGYAPLESGDDAGKYVTVFVCDRCASLYRFGEGL